jgi:hypothetical protein
MSAGSTGNDGSGGAAGTVAMLVWVSPPEPDFDCPGAAAERPGLVEVDLVWPGAAAERPGLVEVLAERPGAAPECPGLVEVELMWPGAAPECPGLVEVDFVWPGAAADCPGPIEVWLEEPVTCAGAVLAGAEPGPRASELQTRPAPALEVAVRAAAVDLVRRGVVGAPRFTACAAGDTPGTGVRCVGAPDRAAGVPWRPVAACEPACVSLSTPNVTPTVALATTATPARAFAASAAPAVLPAPPIARPVRLVLVPWAEPAPATRPKRPTAAAAGSAGTSARSSC